MGTMLKITEIKKKMKRKPKGQRLYDFFDGEVELLTPSQINDVERIVDTEYAKTKTFLTEAKEKVA